MDNWGSQGQDRRYVEERIIQVRCELALGESCGDKSGGAPGAWDLEEELLEELAELEYALLIGTGKRS